MRPLNMPRAKTPRLPRVTDHAVLRWLERSQALDVEAARASILTPSVIEAINCGASAVHCHAKKITLIIAEDGAVKTVLPLKKNRGQKTRGQRA